MRGEQRQQCIARAKRIAAGLAADEPPPDYSALYAKLDQHCLAQPPARLPAAVSAALWHPCDAPLGAGNCSVAQLMSCRKGDLHANARGRCAAIPLCTVAPSDHLHHDLISRSLRAKGHWPECSELVKLWSRHADRHRHTRADGISARAQEVQEVFVDVGANIGACTLEMLQRTNASVIAIEPSPMALFYLTSSLRLAAATRPDIRTRVIEQGCHSATPPTAHCPLMLC